MLQKNYFSISLFFCIFLAKKQSKWIKIEEIRPNSNRLIKLSKIWYVDAFQQKEMLQRKHFRFWHFVGFFGKERAKIDQ